MLKLRLASFPSKYVDFGKKIHLCIFGPENVEVLFRNTVWPHNANGFRDFQAWIPRWKTFLAQSNAV